MKRRIADRWAVAAFMLTCVAAGTAKAQTITKPQVANLIAKVENGVDQFRDYLKKRGDNARSAGSTPQGQSRRAKRGTASETTKAAANNTKDELDDALEALNRSTNRLRRKFDATDAWMETKVQVDAVMHHGRKINQVVARGNSGAESARLWAALRTKINELARAYGMQPMAV